jgi:hypothetical protein
MVSAASFVPDAEGTAAAADDALGGGRTSAASVGAPFGAFTPDEEKRFLTSTDGDKVEAMRRYKACLVRRFRILHPWFAAENMQRSLPGRGQGERQCILLKPVGVIMYCADLHSGCHLNAVIMPI